MDTSNAGKLVTILLLLGGATAWAAPPRRAKPPTFSKSIEDVFFPDARQKLVGPRPKSGAAMPEANSTTSPARPSDSPAASAGEAPAGSKGAWSQWIDAETIEDEIKAQQIKLAEAVQTPTRFKGGDYQKARDEFSVLAAMFAIAAEYDAQVRWQREAGALRDLMARAGFNCKVGTDGSYSEAKKRAEDLETLVRGGSLDANPPNTTPSWPQVTDRPPLMKRLEQSQQQSIAVWTANDNVFSKNVDKLAHEAQLVAALAEVITREGYEFADDETYRGHAVAMRTHALAVRDAARQNNYGQARQAAGDLSKTCASCHEGYRN